MRKELNLGTLGGGAGAAGRSLGEGRMLSLSCVCDYSVLVVATCLPSLLSEWPCKLIPASPESC